MIGLKQVKLQPRGTHTAYSLQPTALPSGLLSLLRSAQIGLRLRHAVRV